MKKILFFLLTIFTGIDATAQEAPKKVLISQVAAHPALDLTVKGIVDGLEKNGYKQGVNLVVRIESAQANMALASQIAVKFVNQNPDVVVGVGTISAQSFAKYARDGRVKLLFSSVTDPVQAGLLNNLDHPGYQISGVSNFVELEPQIQLFQRLQPNLRRLGILYNAGEVNSVSIVNRLEELCPQFGIVLVKQTISKTAEVAQAAAKLSGQVDAIFISNDSTTLSALQSVIGAANKSKIPVYVSDTDAVELGALAALGPNQYQVGLQTGKMIADSLKGIEVSRMSVEFPVETDLYLNEKAAKRLQIEIPEALKMEASKIVPRDPS